MRLVLEIDEQEKTGTLYNRTKHRTGITVDKLVLYFTYKEIRHQDSRIIFDNNKYFDDVKIINI